MYRGASVHQRCSEVPLMVCSANLDILCGGKFSHHFKFYTFMFMHKISIRVVCVNGKHAPDK